MCNSIVNNIEAGDRRSRAQISLLSCLPHSEPLIFLATFVCTPTHMHSPRRAGKCHIPNHNAMKGNLVNHTQFCQK